jgi:hypothetical protein
MADLANDAGALRLRIDLVGREAPGREPGPGGPEGGKAPVGRLLASAGVEYLDRRDGEWWPLLRLPPLHVAPEAVGALAGGLQDLLQGAAPGFAWQSGEDAALGVQMGGAGEGPGDALLVEVGMDVSLFLAEVARVPSRRGAELALFRWVATRAGAVAFAAALRSDLEALLGDG